MAVNDSYSITERDVATNPGLVVSAPGVLANDSSPQGSPLTASLVSGPSHGSLTLNSDGSFVYTPNTGYLGADSFTYKDTDTSTPPDISNTATVSLTVTPRLSIPTNLTGTQGGVVLGPVQILTFGGSNITGGTFTLTFNGATTTPITYGLGLNAQAIMQANIQQALNSLSTIGVGNSSVDATSGTNVIVTFEGALANGPAAPPLMTGNVSGLVQGSSGGTTPSITVGAAVPVNLDNSNPLNSGGLSARRWPFSSIPMSCSMSAQSREPSPARPARSKASHSAERSRAVRSPWRLPAAAT